MSERPITLFERTVAEVVRNCEREEPSWKEAILAQPEGKVISFLRYCAEAAGRDGDEWQDNPIGVGLYRFWERHNSGEQSG